MTDNTNKSTDDAEQMRLAFEQFMLTGGKNNNNNNNNNNSQAKKSNDEASTPKSTSNKSKKKKKKKRQSTTGATPTTKGVTTPPISANKQQQQQSPQQSATTPNPKIKKRYYQLLRSYNDKVKHTWMDIDNQLLSVLQNIGSIRGRLPHEWKVLSQMTRYHPAEEENEGPEQEEKVFNSNDDNDWKSHGHHYEASSKGLSSQFYFTHHHLHLQDVQLALSHDLEQHEKMLVGLRSLMSNLAECHDALGRIVDSLWQFHFEVIGDDDATEDYDGMIMKDDDDDILEYIVNCVTSSYQMLSMELYRKQNIVAVVIESTKDEIFGMDELGKGHNNGVGTKSQALVKECCKSWKRSLTDEEALLSMMKLGES